MWLKNEQTKNDAQVCKKKYLRQDHQYLLQDVYFSAMFG